VSSFAVRQVATVRSPLTDLSSAPLQGHESEIEADIVFEPFVADAVRDVKPGDQLIVLTWLHLADREIQRVHPRADQTQAMQGVFSTRSQDRPNPIGVHVVEVVARAELRLTVRPLEAVDGTPVIDIKPALAPHVSM
jgi:tRNA-Thr(GGU) m(6)t(6)A37 methyltransferase TsaA